MARYNFYQDEKCTVRHCRRFSIEASSREEAIAQAVTVVRKHNYLDEDIQIEDAELRYDTIEPMLCRERRDESAVTLYAAAAGKGCMLADDVHGCAWHSWWGNTDFREMERITGLRQSDFNPEAGYQAFVDACDEWWSGLSADEKIATWWTHTQE